MLLLDHRQRAALIAIARGAVAKALGLREPEPTEVEDSALSQPAGAFVTIRRQRQLRGCIGLIEADFPLYQTVRRAAISAATEDFRFQPLRAAELPQIRLEISVLSPLQDVVDPETIQVGTHGLVIEQGIHKGLLLPQVPREQGWDREEFLCFTCEKAGLPPHAWAQGAKIFCFTALIFGEEPDDPARLYIHMDHEAALRLLQQHVKTANLIKHCLAAEAVLGEVATALKADVPNWRLCGLLHDIDYDLTADEPQRHSLVAEEILRGEGINDELIHAVKAHNQMVPRESPLDKALWAVDPLTGLIVAAALISPDKKLAAIDSQFILNRMKEKSFARGASREQIAACSELGLELDEFIGLGLRGMQQISDDLGL